MVLHRLHKSHGRLQSVIRASHAFSQGHYVNSMHLRLLISTMRYFVQSAQPHFVDRRGSFHRTYNYISDTDLLQKLKDVLSRKEKAFIDEDSIREVMNCLRLRPPKNNLSGLVSLCELVLQFGDLRHVQLTRLTIYAIGYLQNEELALQMIDKFQEFSDHQLWICPNVVTILMQACARMMLFEKGMQVFDIAKKNGLMVTDKVNIALALLRACNQDYDAVISILKKIEGPDLDDFLARILRTMSHIANLHNCHAIAVKVFDRVRIDFTFEPYTALWTDLTLCRAYAFGHEQAALELKAIMASKNYRPTVRDYDTMIQIYALANNMPKVFSVYNELSRKNCKPLPKTMLTMLKVIYPSQTVQQDTRYAKWTLCGLGSFGIGLIPIINIQEHLMTALFIGSLLGSMGLAAYMEPNGILRALYPDKTELPRPPILEALFRRVREEDHAGRAVYVWRENLKHGYIPKAVFCNHFVKICVEKRFPDYAYNTIFGDAASNKYIRFITPGHVLMLIHSLLIQSREKLAADVFTKTRLHGNLDTIYRDRGDRISLDLKYTLSTRTAAFVICQFFRALAQNRSADENILLMVSVSNAHSTLDHLNEIDSDVRSLFEMRNVKHCSYIDKDQSRKIEYYKLIAQPLQVRAFFENL